MKPAPTALRAAPFGLLPLLLLIAGCGYHVAGKADLLPKEVGTIAVPAFENVTTRYRLNQEMAGAVTREFIRRTRYRIVPKPEDADAILYGAVVNYNAYPTTLDSSNGRTAGMLTIVVLDVRLVEEGTGKLLYRNAGLTVQGRYEISTDQARYFEESDTSLQRVSHDVAQTLVSAILEDF